MSRRHIPWTVLLALQLLPVIGSTSASAQTANATPEQGGGSPPFQTCAWYLTISNPGPWAWIQIRFEGHRVFGYGYQDGYESQLYTNVTINGTYLPSQTLTCAIHNAGLEPGWIEYTEGTSYTINHSNPQCDGYPPLDFGYHPGVRIYIDESLGTPNNSEVLEGVQNGQYYWGDVGSELNYTTLNTTNGPDDAFITMSTTLPPDTPGSFNTDTRYIRLNQGYASPSTSGRTLRPTNWVMLSALIMRADHLATRSSMPFTSLLQDCNLECSTNVARSGLFPSILSDFFAMGADNLRHQEVNK